MKRFQSIPRLFAFMGMIPLALLEPPRLQANEEPEQGSKAGKIFIDAETRKVAEQQELKLLRQLLLSSSTMGESTYVLPLFSNPGEFSPENGVLEADVKIKIHDFKLWQPEIDSVVTRDARVIDLKLRSYLFSQKPSKTPGLARLSQSKAPPIDLGLRPIAPTLRVKPGQTIRLNLENCLPRERPIQHSGDQNVPTEFNRTNFHAHGLHVSPSGNSDNVMVTIRPGESHVVEISVPRDHLPGTHWYHPHVHGSTAMQLNGGMAGALIIAPLDGAGDTVLDGIPGIDTSAEHILVFQQIAYHNQTTPTPVVRVNATEPVPGSSTVLDITQPFGTDGKADFLLTYPDGKTENFGVAKLRSERPHDWDYFQKQLDHFIATTPHTDEQVKNLLDDFLSVAKRLKFEATNFAELFDPGKWTAGRKTKGYRTTINGALLPRMEVDGEKLQRLRMIHAGIREPISVSFAKVPKDLVDLFNDAKGGVLSAENSSSIDEKLQEFLKSLSAGKADEVYTTYHEIANDGIPLEKPRKLTSHPLYPGYRSDILLSLNSDPDTPTYYVMWDKSSDGVPSLDASNPRLERLPSLLALIKVKPSGAAASPPGLPNDTAYANLRRPSLPGLPDDPKPEGLQKIRFDLLGGSLPAINGKQYDHAAPPLILKKGRLDRWLVTSSRVNHPFHIHVNPFFIEEVKFPESTPENCAAAKALMGTWKDTLLIEQGVEYKLLMQYDDYIGEFVLHCHILDHEDKGMMTGIEIRNSAFHLGTKLAECYPAPDFELVSGTDPVRSYTLHDVKGDDFTIVAFLEGFDCVACNEQVQKLQHYAQKLGKLKTKIVVIAPEDPAVAVPSSITEFPVLLSSTRSGTGPQFAYHNYEVIGPDDVHPLHGFFVLDKDKKVVWKELGIEPVMDLDGIIDELKMLKE